MRAKPTLDDVGDHERGAGVIADEPTAGQVAFDLQSKQVPGERENREDKRGVGTRRGALETVESNSIATHGQHLHTSAHGVSHRRL